MTKDVYPEYFIQSKLNYFKVIHEKNNPHKILCALHI